jgi:hypothetical protein
MFMNPAVEQARLVKYWEEKRRRILEARKNVWTRRLDRDGVLASRSCFSTGTMLLLDAIDLILIDEDQRASTFLDTAEFYLREAIRTDDLSIYGRSGQVELGRATRVAKLTLVQWLQVRALDEAALRSACTMKEEWNRQLFSRRGWASTAFQLREWMTEKLVIGEFAGAIDVYRQYWHLAGVTRNRNPETTLLVVAQYLAESHDNTKRSSAEQAIDTLYRRATRWTAQTLSDDLLNDEKLLLAYVRGRYFKSVEDPIQLIKMMRIRS